jgi:dihydropyrimidine dehydrogenase (NAD+) subunit PreT
MDVRSLLKGDRAEENLPDKDAYTPSQAAAEAERCLYCTDAPCIQACPTSIDIPTFIKKIATGNVRGSARTILEQNLLGYSCSRVCPVEVLCVGACVYNGWERDPIQIGKLQRHATEVAMAEKGLQALYTPKAKSGKRVACIGAGPASLAFAGYLALEGTEAVIFEKRGVPGGLNTTGVAPYKLKADDSLREVQWILDLGVELRTDVAIGGEVRGSALIAEYDAVFIGVGLGDDSKLGVPGEEGPGVIGAVDWIEQMKLGTARPGSRVLVIGGGNTAIDVARECALLGSPDVALVYRRTRSDMSGYAHEMLHARQEGVRLIESSVVSSFIRDEQGKLIAARIKTAGVEQDVACDLVVVAIGQSKLRTIAEELGVTLDARGCVVVDENSRTNNPKVFAGGDCINGGKEVVNAVADGRNAARHLLKEWA